MQHGVPIPGVDAARHDEGGSAAATMNSSGKSPDGSCAPPREAGTGREPDGVAEGNWHSKNLRHCR